jgi:hypothetical protein
MMEVAVVVSDRYYLFTSVEQQSICMLRTLLLKVVATKVATVE